MRIIKQIWGFATSPLSFFTRAKYIRDLSGIAESRPGYVLLIFVINFLSCWAIASCVNFALSTNYRFSPARPNVEQLVSVDAEFEGSGEEGKGEFLSLSNFVVMVDDTGESSAIRRYLILAAPADSKKRVDLDSWKIVLSVKVIDVTENDTSISEKKIQLEIPAKITPSMTSLNSAAMTNVEWHRWGNIAEKPTLAGFETVMIALKSPRFPVNSMGFCNWLRGNLKSFLAIKDSPASKYVTERFDVEAISVLEREMKRDWEDVSQSTTLILMRVLNGPVQLVTLALALTGWTILNVRCDFLCLRTNDCAKEISTKEKENRLSPRNRAKKILAANPSDREIDRTAVQVLETVAPALAIQKSETDECKILVRDGWQEMLRSRVDDAVSGRHSSRKMVGWLVATLPALGFLGTVIGMSDTIAGASSMLAEDIGKQQAILSGLTGSLAIAFDTTLVGLVCAICLGFANVSAGIKEERSLRSLGNAVHRLVDH